MEFPNLGRHCSVKTCSQLDFLPIKCDACMEDFCRDHVTYASHSCQSMYKKDVQVPVCPLCQKPVPVNRGELPDIRMSEHIDKDCQSDASKRQIYTNRCNTKGCKRRELVPIRCGVCGLNFCLKHRHSTDHNCVGKNAASGIAAQKRAAAQSGRTTEYNGVDEDEALALALHNSMVDDKVPQKSGSMSQEEADEALAKALAQSEQEYLDAQNRGQQRRSDKNCAVS